MERKLGGKGGKEGYRDSHQMWGETGVQREPATGLRCGGEGDGRGLGMRMEICGVCHLWD